MRYELSALPNAMFPLGKISGGQIGFPTVPDKEYDVAVPVVDIE